MPEEFLCETIQPLSGTFDTTAMAAGEPGLPLGFKRGGKEVRMIRLLRKWKSDTPDRTHGGSERYRDKFWYEVETDAGECWRLYFDRQVKARKLTRSWVLHTMVKTDA